MQLKTAKKHDYKHFNKLEIHPMFFLQNYYELTKCNIKKGKKTVGKNV